MATLRKPDRASRSARSEGRSRTRPCAACSSPTSARRWGLCELDRGRGLRVPPRRRDRDRHLHVRPARASPPRSRRLRRRSPTATGRSASCSRRISCASRASPAAPLVVALHAPALALYVLATLTSVFGAVFRPAEASLLPTLARSPEELTAANVSSSTLDSVGSFARAGARRAAARAQRPGRSSSGSSRRRSPGAPRSSRASTRDAAAGRRARRGRAARSSAASPAGCARFAAEPRLRLLIGLYGAQCLVAGALGVLVVVTALDAARPRQRRRRAARGGERHRLDRRRRRRARARRAQAARGRLRARDRPLGRAARADRPRAAHGARPGRARPRRPREHARRHLRDDAPAAHGAPEAAGRVFGVLESVIVGSLALGSLVAPLLMHALGARGALIATGALLPVLAALRWRQLARIDDGARIPEEQLAALRGVPFLALLPLQRLEVARGGCRRSSSTRRDALRARRPGDRFYVLGEGVARDRAARRRQGGARAVVSSARSPCSATSRERPTVRARGATRGCGRSTARRSSTAVHRPRAQQRRPTRSRPVARRGSAVGTTA